MVRSLAKPFTLCGLDFWDFGVEAPPARGFDEIGKNYFSLPFA